MRIPRIKAKKGCDGLYHCMSRTVGGDFVFGQREKEYFVRKMWKIAAFLGIEILDYVVMSNHYHQLVRVPGIVNIGDHELMGRIVDYYGEGSFEAIEYRAKLESGGEQFESLKAIYLKRMGDVSEFEKILKQGFSTWYNRCHKRRGTLWMERFKSVLVQDSLDVRRMIAMYIDLNPVRAGLVDDPKDYRFCGYAAAMGGDTRCRDGIMSITGAKSWAEASRIYRVDLILRGHKRVPDKKGSVSRRNLLQTIKQKGRLSWFELVQLRVRYFSDGLVLGSELFVEEVFERYREHFGPQRSSGARVINGLEGASICVIRDLRIEPIS